jgi:hypothetical protein
MWSKIKQTLRNHAPRTAAELIAAAKIAFQAVSLSDCHGFFSNANYATCFMELL